MREVFPALPGWAIYLFAALALGNFIFAIALWRWKRWGMYGFAAFSLIGTGFNLIGGVGVLPSLLGLAGVALLAYLLRSAWSAMD